MLASLKGYMIAAGAVLVLCLIAGAYFKGRYDVTKIDVIKFAVAEQQAKDEQAATDKTNIANNYVTKEAYAELQVKLAGYTSTNDDLTQRLRDLSAARKPIILSGPVAAPCKPADAGAAGTTAASDSAASGPASASTLPTEVLRDDLTLALQNIQALIVIVDAAAKVQR